MTANLDLENGYAKAWFTWIEWITLTALLYVAGNKLDSLLLKIISQSSSKIELRGFGNDPLGVPFSGYGITLHLKNGEVERVVLHMFDRNVDIEYFR